MPASNVFTIIAADVKAAIAAITAGLKWFADEAKAAIAWVDKNIPGAQATLAALFQAADTAATALEGHAAAGLADVVSATIDDAGTFFLNVLTATGLDLTTKKVLSAADVAAVTAAQSIAQNAISVAAAKVLGATAQLAQGAQAANVGQPAAAPAPPASAA
jgi:hypothetical protein